MENFDLKKLLDENRRRRERLEQVTAYDPLVGNPADPLRRRVVLPFLDKAVWLPQTMIDDEAYPLVTSREAYERLRVHHDFEFWAALCVVIRHKETGRMVPFVLNAPQRRVLKMFEEDRLAGLPLRFIMLKARQWGGSTLVQMYFAWIQSELRTNWHSLISAHVRDTAANIRGMYSAILDNYPRHLWSGDEDPRFRPWEGSTNIREIAGRGCRVTLSSCAGQDSVRGLDIALAHLSEVAYWRDADKLSATAYLRSVMGGVPMIPLSAIVMESTACGVGNYFHTQWLLAQKGESAFRPVFVPWFEIEMYSRPCPDPETLWQNLNAYERELWNKGLTLEQIMWYHCRRREIGMEAMQTEYPSDPVEAFANSGHPVFRQEDVEALRALCRNPLEKLPEGLAADDLKAVPGPDGELKVWRMPGRDVCRWTDRYLVSVDIGGRHRNSDYSVVTVIDRMGGADSDTPEVVAQWRGHCDYDLLAAYCAGVGRAYGNALLIVESNSLESSAEGSARFILERLNMVYPNMYVRTNVDAADGFGQETRVGFHTNRSTKVKVINALIERVRRASYIERDTRACDELAVYEQLPDGSYAATRTNHDDLLMTRAISLYVHSIHPAPWRFDKEDLL